MRLKTTKDKPIKLVAINFKKDELLFYKSFIDRIGGISNAKEHLKNIIDRYFHEEYLDPDLEQYL